MEGNEGGYIFGFGRLVGYSQDVSFFSPEKGLVCSGGPRRPTDAKVRVRASVPHFPPAPPVDAPFRDPRTLASCARACPDLARLCCRTCTLGAKNGRSKEGKGASENKERATLKAVKNGGRFFSVNTPRSSVLHAPAMFAVYSCNTFRAPLLPVRVGWLAAPSLTCFSRTSRHRPCLIGSTPHTTTGLGISGAGGCTGKSSRRHGWFVGYECRARNTTHAHTHTEAVLLNPPRPQNPVHVLPPPPMEGDARQQDNIQVPKSSTLMPRPTRPPRAPFPPLPTSGWSRTLSCGGRTPSPVAAAPRR